MSVTHICIIPTCSSYPPHTPMLSPIPSQIHAVFYKIIIITSHMPSRETDRKGEGATDRQETESITLHLGALLSCVQVYS